MAANPVHNAVKDWPVLSEVRAMRAFLVPVRPLPDGTIRRIKLPVLALLIEGRIFNPRCSIGKQYDKQS